MKKVHALSALLLAATLTFGSLNFVFAADTAADTSSAPAKVYAALEVTAKSFYNLRYAEVGKYPVIKGYDDLNAKILKSVEEAFALATDKAFTDSNNVFAVSYKVTDSEAKNGQFATIEVTYDYQLIAQTKNNYSDVKTYYVDKELAKEIDKAAFDEGIKDEPAKDETAPADEPKDEAVNTEAAQKSDEPVMVPIRVHAVGLGYTVTWDDSTKSVIITKDDARFTVTVGKNEYLVDNKIVALDSAPTNQNGTVYVPVSFFEKSLGAVYSVDTDGNISIKAK